VAGNEWLVTGGEAETGDPNACQRALAGQPAAGSPKGDMSGSEGGKPETGDGDA